MQRSPYSLLAGFTSFYILLRVIHIIDFNCARLDIIHGLNELIVLIFNQPSSFI